MSPHVIHLPTTCSFTLEAHDITTTYVMIVVSSLLEMCLIFVIPTVIYIDHIPNRNTFLFINLQNYRALFKELGNHDSFIQFIVDF